MQSGLYSGLLYHLSSWKIEETSQRKNMPYRYTDVNIKLHQYQGWKSGGLRVLWGFKETVLVAKGKQTFSM